MPTIRQLQYLVAVDDERHFGRASERVHVSQPTLSAQLAQLELRIKVKLFTRGRNGVYPTPAGQEIIARARKILSEVDALREFAQRVSHPLSGRVRFGIPPTLGPYVLPHIVPELHRQFPDLKLLLREGAPRDIQRMVEDGTIDIALTPLPILPNKLHIEEIFEERLQVGMAWDHHLATKDSLTGQDLKDEKVLAMVSGYHLHDQVKELCDAYGAELLYEYEGSSLDALRHMVVMGAGISFFPALYILSEISDRKDLTVKKIDGERLHRDIAMIWRKDSHLLQEFEELSRLFRKQANRILGVGVAKRK